MKTRISLLIVCLLASAKIFASDGAGVTGAEFLKMGSGARPAAMGNAYTATGDDLYAVSFNPAGLANISRSQLGAMHSQWFQDINYDFVGFAYPTDFGAFALSGATLKVTDVQKRDASESLLGHFNALDSAYALSYSRNIKSLLSVGATARYIRQEIDDANSSSWAADIGFIRRFDRRPLTLGFSIRNLGQSVKFREQSDPLPTLTTLGLGYSLLNERLKLAFDLKRSRTAEFDFCSGVELRFDISTDVRAAFRSGYDSGLTDAGGAHGMSFGAGFGFGRIDFDFSWVPFGDLGNTFRYSALLRF